MTFCPDDQTNPSLRVVFCARKFLSSGRQRDNKKAFKVLWQMREKKLITHARHSLTLLFCAWCLVFCIRGVCGGFWHTPHSAMMLREYDPISYDSLPRLDVFCDGLVITKFLKTVFWAEIRYKTFPSRMLRSICVRCASSCHFSFVSFFARERRWWWKQLTSWHFW